MGTPRMERESYADGGVFEGRTGGGGANNTIQASTETVWRKQAPVLSTKETMRKQHRVPSRVTCMLPNLQCGECIQGQRHSPGACCLPDETLRDLSCVAVTRGRMLSWGAGLVLRGTRSQAAWAPPSQLAAPHSQRWRTSHQWSLGRPAAHRKDGNVKRQSWSRHQPPCVGGEGERAGRCHQVQAYGHRHKERQDRAS